jgi:hypothetical protein
MRAHEGTSRALIKISTPARNDQGMQCARWENIGAEHRLFRSKRIALATRKRDLVRSLGGDAARISNRSFLDILDVIGHCLKVPIALLDLRQ